MYSRSILKQERGSYQSRLRLGDYGPPCDRAAPSPPVAGAPPREERAGRGLDGEVILEHAHVGGVIGHDSSGLFTTQQNS